MSLRNKRKSFALFVLQLAFSGCFITVPPYWLMLGVALNQASLATTLCSAKTTYSGFFLMAVQTVSPTLGIFP